MDKVTHDMHELFAQLGLPAGSGQIDRFIREHHRLAPGLALADAPFWTSAQAAFLRESMSADADWAVIVDLLNVELHRGHGTPQAPLHRAPAP